MMLALYSNDNNDSDVARAFSWAVGLWEIIRCSVR